MQDFFNQYHANINAGDTYVNSAGLPTDGPAAYPVKFIAFYLPQFHRIVENDDWWGPGFTEWTNVTKAVPRYKNHLQPRLPADLGFYDLSNPDTIYRQANLAKRGGIAGFCIHNYWFAGRQILETPLEIILQNSDIDLPFCLNWANENWSRRWDGSEQDILLEQIYNPQHPTGYVESIIPALSDKRYIRVDGRPLLLVYRPELIPNAEAVFASWRDFLSREGMGDPLLVRVQNFARNDPREFAMDATVLFPPHAPDLFASNDKEYHQLLDLGFQGLVRDYGYLAQSILDLFSTEFLTFPGVAPGWDNEARKPRHGVSFAGASPSGYARWLEAAANQVMSANPAGVRFVFINAWNEWAEGAVIEPDRFFGHAYLAATRTVLDSICSNIQQPREFYRAGFQRDGFVRFSNRVRRKLNKYGAAIC